MKSACVLAGVSEGKLYNYTIRPPFFSQIGVWALKRLVPWRSALHCVVLQLIAVVLNIADRGAAVMLLKPAAQIHKPERHERRAAGGCMAVSCNVYETLAKARHNLSKAKKAEFNLILFVNTISTRGVRSSAKAAQSTDLIISIIDEYLEHFNLHLDHNAHC